MVERVKAAIECDDGEDYSYFENNAQSIEVHEFEAEYSGLLNADGEPLYRPKRRIGFI
jgi:hypothetical protein